LLLLIDNYDSFTYNLQDYFAQLSASCEVIRNDQKNLEEIIAEKPAGIIFSPGPERPATAGIMMEIVRHFHDKIPLLGICLGHQAIGEFFGATLTRAEKPMHGKTSAIHHAQHPVFKNVSDPFEAMRYHSLLLQDISRTVLQVIATSDRDEVMAIVHPEYKICGIQFHPESILTPGGITILDNWLYWSHLK
jgi:anthranilate synthase/aminodeoxychorismate synthase-like glutamine amidotransferase